jgi:N-acetylglucosaminyltransferase
LNGFAVIMPLYLGIVPFYALRQRRLAADGLSVASLTARVPRWSPSVDVIVTCYNEQPDLLAACLRSLRDQDYRGPTRVWVVDDGSDNRDLLLPVLRREVHPSWQILLLGKNRGKRVAQAKAFEEGRGTVVVWVDSDTVVAEDGIRRIVTPFRHKAVGAVTGNLRASNAGYSWLTRAIDVRYQLLCERERAAQSFHGAVLCCAGPFSAYRRSAVKRVLQRYLAGRRRAARRRSGDDLVLTNLVLKEGYRSEYQPAARAWTHVPTSLLGFARQQRRWNRSFYRELPRMLRLVSSRGPYMALDLVARALVPPMVAAGLLITAADSLLAPQRVPFDMAAIALMALASVELLPSLRRVPARTFALPYGLIFVGLLLPIRFWAACTFLRDQWGTRELPSRSLFEPAQQLTRVRLTDLIPLLPVEVDGMPQGAGRFTAAAVEAQHLGQVEARLGS